MYRKASGEAMTDEEMRYHVINILSGMYSLGGQPDKAMIEYRVKFDPVFEKIAYQGVPDVRIIVFMGVPVMAMVRLPTRMSDGKANLHQGAIGTGVDIATGKTLTAVWKNFIIDDHPDTGEPVVGIQIPGWDDLLRLASKSYELTGLGYQGIDVVLDKNLGPLILELNARPGLNIQIANNCGLENRILLAKKNLPNLKTVEEKIAFAKANFRSAF
jgi:alpha-L-glutamate ligase-like protein